MAAGMPIVRYSDVTLETGRGVGFARRDDRERIGLKMARIPGSDYTKQFIHCL